MNKISIIFFLILLSGLFISPVNQVYSNEPGYQEVFGKNWSKAQNFIAENREWMQRTAHDSKVDFHFVTSVIFPELIRYSAIRDRMEITLLKALYVNKGTEYANFSVGLFQIKPLCAGQILDEIQKSGERRFKKQFSEIISCKSVIERRQKIVHDLENPQREFLYVIAIVKILEEKFKSVKWNSNDEKLVFFATAYNCGFLNSEDFIRKQQGLNTFHTGLISSEKQYSYADIALTFNRFENK